MSRPTLGRLLSVLGWHVSVYRQSDGGAAPASSESAKGARLAVWHTGTFGLDWLDPLIESGEVVALGGNGYPTHYTAQARVLLPHLEGGPPRAKEPWPVGPNDVVTEKWEGRTRVENGEIASCRPEEWLVVEVWDES